MRTGQNAEFRGECMFKIGEFSNMVRVSARMLRHYDQCGLLSPAEIDRFTGYRLYNAEQIPQVTRIVALRDMGFGIEEIKELLPNYSDANFMTSALEQKRRIVENLIAEEQSKLTNIAAMCERIMEEKNMVYEVEVKTLPTVKVLSLREVIPSGEDEPAMWEKLSTFAKANSIPYSQNGGYSLYHDDEYKDSDLDVEIAIPVNEFGTDKDGFVYRELEAFPQAATIQFSGSYHGYNAAIEKLAKWVEQNGYVFDGMIRGLAIKTYANAASEDDFLTELQVSVKKA